MTTTITLTVHACPPGQVRAVLDVIHTWQLVDDIRPADDRITLGEGYQNHSGRGGSAEEIHTELLHRAPDAASSVGECATSEWLGEIFRHVPGLGVWTASADPDGDPCYTADQVYAASALSTSDRDAFLGRPWTAAVAALSDTGDVAAPRAYQVTWDRRTGLVHVENAAPDGTDMALPKLTGRAGDDPAAAEVADQALRAAGFVRADLWLGADRHGRIQETEVYRVADAYPQPPTATDAGEQLRR